MFKKVFLTTTAVFFWTSACLAQVLSATVNRTQVPLGESFDLTLSLDGGNNGGAIQPDLSTLQKDFNIYSTSNSMQSSFVNGQSSVTRRWIIGLMPKKEGKFTIPAISAGAYQTQPIEIEVLPPAQMPAQIAHPNNQTAPSTGNNNQIQANKAYIAAELKVDNMQPYVQQQTNATLTIYDEKGIELTIEPNFTEPTNDWVIKTLKKPTVDNLAQGGRVIRFYFALFPQKSGSLEIPPFNIEGFYTEYNKAEPQNMGFGGFMNMFELDWNGLFGVRKPISTQTKPVKVEVKPISADYGNHWWLPASAVGTAVRWAEDKPQFKVGETFAREIAIAAEGVAATQMPEIKLPETPDIKQYPEQPQISSTVNDNTVTSHMQMRIVYIPQKAGKLEIPEIRIPWFNVETGKTETAVIPADTILVQNNPLMDAKVSDTEIQNQPQKQEVSENTYIYPHNASTVNHNIAGLMTKIQIGIALFLAFLAGLGLSWFWLKHKTSQQTDEKDKANLNALEQSLKQKDYRMVRDCLLACGQNIFSERTINNLDDLATAVNNKVFQEQMNLLNANLYAGKSDELNADIIMQSLKKTKKRKKNIIPKPLPDLYK